MIKLRDRRLLEPELINKRIRIFKRELADHQPIEVVRRNIIYGSCAAIEDSSYFGLRSEIADKYQIHPNEVLVVGSSKLGFSIAPSKRYRHFTETSDIDVVVVSEQLFNKTWQAAHYFWDHGGYWEKLAEFRKYLFRGWIRPDKMPAVPSFQFSHDWWKFFNDLSSGGKYSPYKIRGALYKDWYFLEAYQLRSVIACGGEGEGGG